MFKAFTLQANLPYTSGFLILPLKFEKGDLQFIV